MDCCTAGFRHAEQHVMYLVLLYTGLHVYTHQEVMDCCTAGFRHAEQHVMGCCTQRVMDYSRWFIFGQEEYHNRLIVS